MQLKRIDHNEELVSIAKLSSKHKEFITKSKNVGCYYCCTIYPNAEIQEWCDNGTTALCSRCGIDSVLPDYSVVLGLEFLREMQDYWFESGGLTYKTKDGKIIDILDEDGRYDPQEFEAWKLDQLAERAV